MGKALIIAEKPSVARDIAAALGGFKKNSDDVLERDDALVSSGIGHLVQLALPEGVDKGWELPALPVIPANFSLEPIQKTAAQLRLLGKLIKRADVDCVINACDAGREGELIFRYIYLILGCKKPIKRMWLQSMTADAIRDAHRNMRTGAQMDALFQAAMSRSEADWLVGVNATRALTKFRDRQGIEGDGVASAGRVQTPVLALLYDREMAINNFVPRDYWEIHGEFRLVAGSYGGKWFDPKFQKSDDDSLKAERIFDSEQAKEIEAKCRGCDPESVTEESKPTTSAPPKLYDLTTLQREANSKYGFSAKQTLDIAQALYESHKVLTYPRTDATALPEDYIDTAKKTLATFDGTQYAPHAQRVLSNGWVRPNKRIFDNAKISDHFAIIPNGNKPSSLSADEAKIYSLVVKRFIAAFHPAAEYLQTTRITVVSGESFKSQGSVLVSEGWLAVYGREVECDGEGGKSLCKLVPGESATTESVKRVGLKTEPPQRYTEATLLSAMENAGRLVDDDELKEAMKARGLGTPATRAAVIEELLSASKSYARRDKKYLVITQKGIQIIELLRNLGVEMLTSPEMTGDWEHKLSLIEEGKYTRREFMEQVRNLATQIVERIREKAFSMPDKSKAKSGGAQGEPVNLSAPCPKCDGLMAGNGMKYSCQACDFGVWREVAGRILSPEEVDALLREKITPVLDGFISSKTKKTFSAQLKLSDAMDKLEFVFPQTPASPVAMGEALGKCPKCGDDVVEARGHYFCAKSLSRERGCDFKIWGEISNKKISKSIVKTLLAQRRTGLLDGFKSNRTKNSFSAFLVMNSSHEITFEFEKSQ